MFYTPYKKKFEEKIIIKITKSETNSIIGKESTKLQKPISSS
jgi:hypothetical protein